MVFSLKQNKSMTEFTHNNMVEVVDKEGNDLEPVDYRTAKANKMVCKSARVYVVSESGSVLLQTRSNNLSNPGCFDVSVAGHVEAGDSFVTTIKKELEEEIGLVTQNVETISQPEIDGLYFSQTFVTVVPDNSEFTLEPTEVSAVKWFIPDEIDELVQTKSDSCTPSLVTSWPKYRDKIISI